MSTGPDVLEWLLEKKDPGVRFFTRRDVLGAGSNDAELQAARRATLGASPVRDILEAQHPEGLWVKPGPGNGPKYTGTVWQVIFLGQFGADGRDRRIRRAADYVLGRSRAPCGGFSASAAPSGLVHCPQGNLAAAMLEMGFDDGPRLQQALGWPARSLTTGKGIAASKRKDAPVRYLRSANSALGFCCSVNNQPPCAWGTIPAMGALSRVPAATRPPAIRRATKMGTEFLLSRDPAIADYPMGYARAPSSWRFQFGYPMGYVTDALRNAEVLVALGRGKDRRLRSLAEWILSRWRPDGRWHLDRTYKRKAQPSKWMTVRALRALRGNGGLRYRDSSSGGTV